MRKLFLLSAVFLGFAGTLRAQASIITLPAAASIVGGAPFFSDVRAFNTSYASSLEVTATYRCFIASIGSSCPSIAPQSTFTLVPRESRAFNDIVAATFLQPNTAGGVEFVFDAAEDQLVVTSRLYSTFPTPTVGMFIPGMDEAEAHATTVLTSIQNGDDGRGNSFRTNVGVFNPGSVAVTVTFTIFDGNGAVLGAPVTRPLNGHSGLQVSGIFTVAGVPTTATDNAVIVAASTGAVFSYAAVIDNLTTDPIFVSGAPDQPPQPITPAATSTRTPTQPGPTATRTPTQPGPTPTLTPTSPPATRTVNVGQGGTNFVDQVSGTSTTTIHVGDTVNWVWASGPHSTTSGPCPPCSGDGNWDSGVNSSPHEFTPSPNPFTQAGTFSYFCSVHGSVMTGTVVVNP
jgi:plastocyanin